MIHQGKAKEAAWRMLMLTGFLLLAVLAATLIKGGWVALIGVWVLFAGFVLYFFRDPNPAVPSDPRAIVSPAHGKIDIIDTLEVNEFNLGKCQRISMFLSIFNVHVQNAPISGSLMYMQHHPGEFLNAMDLESGARNENMLMVFDSSEKAGEKIGVRLIAGLIARRIVPWIQVGNTLKRGDRISLIRFGSRCDLYLPLDAKILVKKGDKVVGGETVMAYRA